VGRFDYQGGGPGHRYPEEVMTEPVARTVKDCMRTYGWSKSTIYRHLAAGRLRAKKDGATTLILEKSARELFNSLPDSVHVMNTPSTPQGDPASTSASTSDAGIGRDAPGRLGKAKLGKSNPHKQLWDFLEPLGKET
jgi:hypothetical protein